MSCATSCCLSANPQASCWWRPSASSDAQASWCLLQKWVFAFVGIFYPLSWSRDRLVYIRLYTYLDLICSKAAPHTHLVIAQFLFTDPAECTRLVDPCTMLNPWQKLPNKVLFNSAWDSKAAGTTSPVWTFSCSLAARHGVFRTSYKHSQSVGYQDVAMWRFWRIILELGAVIDDRSLTCVDSFCWIPCSDTTQMDNYFQPVSRRGFCKYMVLFRSANLRERTQTRAHQRRRHIFKPRWHGSSCKMRFHPRTRYCSYREDVSSVPYKREHV